eukprot:TRINITY_DN17948_c0_g1_i1.p1 TRINITY_DN17948_c0_g1~~TRINITY_DN17948_c0_g1_i1.p1  ORF type:complete len:1154 (+),score=214.05 TRINITY_DN17948_c0_g1_i1:55-3462(+)
MSRQSDGCREDGAPSQQQQDVSLTSRNPFGVDGAFTQLAEKLPVINRGLQVMHRQAGNQEAYLRARERNPLGPDGAITRVAERVPLVNNMVQGVHHMRQDDERLARARAKNPIGANGVLTRGAERVPVVNNVVQNLHRHGGHEDALERAKARNPLGPDGGITRGLERVPFVNHAIQGLHAAAGDDDALRRAKEKNPLGKDGYIVKASEQVPVLADVAVAMHSLFGNEGAAERARAHSLQKIMGKDGAITKVAELVPVLNVAAGVLLELGGHHEEAQRALHIVQNWREIGDPDGALYKMAEQLHGTDVIAFWKHLNESRYARALRSITKTSWVQLSIDHMVVHLVVPKLVDMRILELRVSDIDVRPKAPSLVGGCMDVALHFLESDATTQRRRRWKEKRARELSQPKTQADVRSQLQTAVTSALNDALGDAMVSLADSLPEIIYENIAWSWDYYLEEWPGAAGAVLRVILPAELPRPSVGLDESIRTAASGISLVHRPFPVVPEVRRRNESDVARTWRAGVPEVAGAVACVSCVGGMACSAPIAGAGVACLAGCLAGVAAAARAITRTFAPWLNSWNAEAWERSTRPPPTPEKPAPLDVGNEVLWPDCLWNPQGDPLTARSASTLVATDGVCSPEAGPPAAVDLAREESPASESGSSPSRVPPGTQRKLPTAVTALGRVGASTPNSGAHAGTLWHHVSRGAAIPARAICAGSTSTDGVVFVGRRDGEAGKINTEDGKPDSSMWNFWGHAGSPPTEDAEILLLKPGAMLDWLEIRRGRPIPVAAVEAGRNAQGVQNYVGRYRGEAGKINATDGCMLSFWGNHMKHSDVAEVLVVQAAALNEDSHVSAGRKYASGDHVQVWSNSAAKWTDGVVEQVYEEDGVHDGYAIRSGTVKVVFSAGQQRGTEVLKTKYLAADLVGTMMRRRAPPPTAATAFAAAAAKASLPMCSADSVGEAAASKAAPSIVAELPRAATLELATRLRGYLGEAFGGTCLGALCGLLESPLRALLSRSIAPQGVAVPFMIDFEVAAMWLDLGPAQVWMPAFGLCLILDLRLENGGPWIWRARITMLDEAMDQLLEVLRKQIQELDIRLFDPEALDGFMEPIHLNFDLALTWPESRTSDMPRIELRDVQSKLYLPA